MRIESIYNPILLIICNLYLDELIIRSSTESRKTQKQIQIVAVITRRRLDVITGLCSKLIYNNLMWDKRIVRGNTYAAIVTSKNNDANARQSNIVYR